MQIAYTFNWEVDSFHVTSADAQSEYGHNWAIHVSIIDT